MATKGRLSKIEGEAIGWWSRKNNLTPQLSAYPVYYFRSKESGEDSNVHIDNITLQYKAHKKEEAKEAARAKKQKMQKLQK